MIQQYFFRVIQADNRTVEFVVDIDPDLPLIENFEKIVDESKGTESEISIVRTTETGAVIEVPWGFAWGDLDSGDIAELRYDLSLAEQDVPAGAEILAQDIYIPGAANAGMPEDAEDRIRHDRIAFMRFVEANPRHLKVTKWGIRTISVTINEVKGVIGADATGAPLFGSNHGLKLVIPPGYPYYEPSLIPQSAILHPNIKAGAACPLLEWDPCWNDSWSFLVRQYVDMIQYVLFNLEEPHRNHNPQASDWLEARIAAGDFEHPLRPRVVLRSSAIPRRVHLSIHRSQSVAE